MSLALAASAHVRQQQQRRRVDRRPAFVLYMVCIRHTLDIANSQPTELTQLTQRTHIPIRGYLWWRRGVPINGHMFIYTFISSVFVYLSCVCVCVCVIVLWKSPKIGQ